MLLSRMGRQAVVVSVLVVAIVLVGIGVYYKYLKAPETCFDGKQNQNEQGVDCGGVCTAVCDEKIVAQDLEVREIAFVPSGNNRYDAFASIHNPNDTFGASAFVYRIDLKDASGNVVASRSGKSFILPQEKKSLMEMNIETPTAVASMSVAFSDLVWERFSGYQEKPPINIYNKNYSLVSDGVNYSKATGLVSNESPYDFRSIIVKVILRDQAGKVLAINSTEQRTVKSHEQREFILPWPTAFPGTVDKVDMEVDADVFHSDNFIRQYMPAGKFQDLAPTKAY